MSGTYGLEKFIKGPVTEDYYYSSPLHFVPGLDEDGGHLAQLRERFVLLAHGEGRYEDPEESWKIERVLGPKGVPNGGFVGRGLPSRLGNGARDAAQVPRRVCRSSGD